MISTEMSDQQAIIGIETTLADAAGKANVNDFSFLLPFEVEFQKLLERVQIVLKTEV